MKKQIPTCTLDTPYTVEEFVAFCDDQLSEHVPSRVKHFYQHVDVVQSPLLRGFLNQWLKDEEARLREQLGAGRLGK